MPAQRRSIAQEDASGCGIACVAFICGMSYRTAKRSFGKPESAGTKGYLCNDIVRALSKSGKRYNWKRIRAKPNWRENSIVFIARSERYPAGHYLAKAKNGWMDSWMNFPKVLPVRSGFRKKLPGKAQYLIYHDNKRR